MAIAYTHDGHTADNLTASSASYTLTAAIAVGERIIVWSNATSSRNTTAVADTQGNVYSIDGAGGQTTISSAHCTVALSIGDVVTVTFSGSSTGHMVAVGKLTGQAVVAFDKTAGKTGSTSPASSGNTATTSQANEILLGNAGILSASLTEDAAFTRIESFTFAAGGVTQDLAYRIVSATGTYAYAPTFTGTHGNGSVIATYREFVNVVGQGLLIPTTLEPRRLVI